MNKKYDQTDRERDQTGRLGRADADKQLVRQDGESDVRHQAGEGPRRIQADWPEDEGGRDGKSDAVRDSVSGENPVDEP